MTRWAKLLTFGLWLVVLAMPIVAGKAIVDYDARLYQQRLRAPALPEPTPPVWDGGDDSIGRTEPSPRKLCWECVHGIDLLWWIRR